ncbi:MAG: HAD hydrolase-like protein [Microgenomates group bacterium]
MVPLELPRSSFPEMRDRLNPKEAFLKICTPDFAGTNIMGITADFIMQNNIHAVFLDAEGTFIKTWGTLPHPQLAEHMRSLKERLDAEGYDFKTAIVTNRKMGNLATFTAAQYWIRDLNADLLLSPLFPEWRKPKPFMVELTAQQLGMPVEQVLMVGDKLTGDIAAGNRAGAKTYYVEEMVGEVDLLGDQIFRRPLEREMYKQMADRVKHVDAPSLAPYMDIPSLIQLPTEIVSHDIDWWNPQWKETELGKKLLELPNKVYGYGIPFDDSSQKTWGSRTLYVHGGEIADIVTDMRVPLTFTALLLRHLGYKKSANTVQIVAEASDFIDGQLARRSKRGPTQKGADADRGKDKQAAALRRGSLFVAGKLPAQDLAARVGADFAMTKIAHKLRNERGIQDVSAVWPGKLATAGESAADTLAERIADSHPHISELVSTIATIAKIGRIPSNTHLWNQRHRLREVERPILLHVAIDLLRG